jgi:hypothetical protein
MLQYSVFQFSDVQVVHGNAAFGERRLPHKNRDSYVFGSLGVFFSASLRLRARYFYKERKEKKEFSRRGAKTQRGLEEET